MNKQQARWDKMAGQFDALQIPQWDSDPFLKILNGLSLWDKDCNALDLGCGAGRHTIALSKRCRSATGTDISPKMIDFANQKKEAHSAKNCSFFTADWNELDVDAAGLTKQFDLIIAHMTPALSDIASLEKLNRCAKGWCAMATFQNRKAPQQAALLELLGLPSAIQSHIPDLFTYLYEQGMCPQVTYYTRDDSRTLSVAEAISFYQNGLPCEATPEICSTIVKYVQQIAVDNIVTNTVHSNIVCMTWNVNQ